LHTLPACWLSGASAALSASTIRSSRLRNFSTRSAEDLHRRAMAGIIPKNLRTAIKRRVDHAVQVFWNGICIRHLGCAPDEAMLRCQEGNPA
jgi:hypothetical protein